MDSLDYIGYPQDIKLEEILGWSWYTDKNEPSISNCLRVSESTNLLFGGEKGLCKLLIAPIIFLCYKAATFKTDCYH